MKGMIMIASAAAAMLMAGGCGEKKPLHIYTWADYISPTVIERFEEKPEIMAKAQVILGLESIPGAMEMYAKAWDRIRGTK